MCVLSPPHVRQRALAIPATLLHSLTRSSQKMMRAVACQTTMVTRCVGAAAVLAKRRSARGAECGSGPHAPAATGRKSSGDLMLPPAPGARICRPTRCEQRCCVQAVTIQQAPCYPPA